MKDIVLLDLDGTLTDSGPGIRESVLYALKSLGLEDPGLKTLNCFIGPPLLTSFREFAGLDEEGARMGVKYYREHYAKDGLYNNSLYEGIPQMLSRMKEMGVTCVLATSKPETFAIKILKQWDLEKYFDIEAGAAMDETRTSKSQVIEYALGLLAEKNKGQMPDKSRMVMVGDRKHDICGAARFGIPCIGVLFGYGSAEEFKAAGAAAMARTPMDVCDLLLKL